MPGLRTKDRPRARHISEARQRLHHHRMLLRRFDPGRGAVQLRGRDRRRTGTAPRNCQSLRSSFLFSPRRAPWSVRQCPLLPMVIELGRSGEDCGAIGVFILRHDSRVGHKNVVMIVEVTQLTKTFGSFTAVNEVSFAIKEGEILGLLGPNGAGKTTTILMLLGLTTPTSGSIRIFNRGYDRDRETILTG